ncbi:beta-ketoacyl-[acyl-carrier-protein] synthase family protein [Cellvibrio japonicus]|uniref:Beta-ketoacyl synthase n=1 Tax=Cellvibrio japonicus (strain Ueda107) TaxID=498211 RepID=B3PFI1_CELJU|nr:beta-ketoacyl-[acyl-carrier-protein] synthase family protein [Cellvibrio japonicus]ACE83380.1 Beta-ketoacyl synthase [Cellvibrio japonicus Ueda107]
MIFGKMTPLRITSYTYTTCLGAGLNANWDAIQAGRSGLQPCTFFRINDLDTWVGEVAGLDQALPPSLAEFDCRNNRLSWLALQQDGFITRAQSAIARYGAARVGIFIGTSTSGIHQTELAYFANQDPLPAWYQYRTTHNVSSVATFVRAALGASGPAIAISTACSSSAKVFASAQRALNTGLCDAAIVGGVDSLCLTTLYGFHALQLISPRKCQPFDSQRSGISIGEAGGFALLEKTGDSNLCLLGYGESGDAYHMSSPHPEGAGAQLAMGAALRKAGLDTSAIDYINLHGTGTQTNDSAEARAVQQLFGNTTPASSTKGWTGHTLGAAGIVEACIALEAINYHYLPQSLHLQDVDEGMDIALLKHPETRPVARVLSNSFGFGGSNCSLILGSH